MRTLRLTLFLLALLGGGLCSAEDVAINPLSLVGTWVGTETKANAGEFTTYITLTQSAKFSGTVAFQGRVILQYSGRWELKGNRITWFYDTMIPPLPDALKIDTDAIVVVDTQKLVLVSLVTGLLHEFSRKTQT